MFRLVSLHVHLQAKNIADLGNSEESQKEPAKKNKARIQIEQQQSFLSQLANKEKKYKEAWGLFSYGGWSDRGSCWIFKKNRGYELFYAKPNTSKFLPYEAINITQLTSFIAATSEFDRETDFELKAFDGIQYEYVHYKQTEEGPLLIKRIFMNNPGISEDGRYIKASSKICIV